MEWHLRPKTATVWQKRFSRGLHRLEEELSPHPVRTFGVYLGGRRTMLDNVDVLPAKEFLKALWDGELIP